MSLFWTPSRATRISLLASAFLASFDLILLSLVPQLVHQESLLTFLSCLLALAVIALCLLSNRLVEEAKEEEVRAPFLSGHTRILMHIIQGRIVENRARNLREAERRAELLLVAEEGNYWVHQIWGVAKRILLWLLVFSTTIVLCVSLIDISSTITTDFEAVVDDGRPRRTNVRLNLPTSLQELSPLESGTRRLIIHLQGSSHMYRANGTPSSECNAIFHQRR